MAKNNKKLPKKIMPKGFDEEDIIQRSMHAEARFLKNLAKQRYNKVWMFTLTYLAGLFYLLIGIIGLALCAPSVLDGVRLRDLALVLPSTLFSLIALLVCFAGMILLARLIKVFKTKDKKYKTETLLLAIIPTLLFVFLVIAIIISIPSINFSF